MSEYTDQRKRVWQRVFASAFVLLCAIAFLVTGVPMILLPFIAAVPSLGFRWRDQNSDQNAVAFKSRLFSGLLGSDRNLGYALGGAAVALTVAIEIGKLLVQTG